MGRNGGIWREDKELITGQTHRMTESGEHINVSLSLMRSRVLVRYVFTLLGWKGEQ